MQIEPMPLSQLLAMANPRNAKTHSHADIAASFRRFGFVAFPTLDEATATIVAGHGRCETLEMMRAEGQQPPFGVTIAACARLRSIIDDPHQADDADEIGPSTPE